MAEPLQILNEVRARVDVWRQKQRDGTLTDEEAKEAISVLRDGRIAAAAATKSTTTKKVDPASIKFDDI